MLSDMGYYDEYKIELSSVLDVVEYSQFEVQHKQYLTRLKITWEFYSIFMNIYSLVKLHPNYAVNGTGKGEFAYNRDMSPKSCKNDFNSLNSEKLYDYCYNIIALKNFAKGDIKENMSSVDTAFRDNIQFKLVTDSGNGLFDNLNLYVPLFGRNRNMFYKMSSSEGLFVSFIVKSINYLVSVTKYTSTDVRTSIDLKVTESQISDIFKGVYGSVPKSSSQLVVDMCNIGDYIVPYVYRFSDILGSLEIPNFLLGVTVYDYLMQSKLDVLLKINGYESLISGDSYVLTLSN